MGFKRYAVSLGWRLVVLVCIYVESILCFADQPTEQTKSAADIRGHATAMAFTYDKDRHLYVFLYSDEPAVIQVDKLEFSEEWKWGSACDGAMLWSDNPCMVIVDPAESTSDASNWPPDILSLRFTAEGMNAFGTVPVSKITSPYEFLVNDQQPNAAYRQYASNALHLPATKTGDQGDAIEVHFYTQHFTTLQISSIHAPAYISVINHCADKQLPSLLVERRNDPRHCKLELRYNPKDDTQTDGELVVEFDDGERQYPVTMKLLAQPWKPLLASKISVVEGKYYVLLRDGTLWQDAYSGGWSQVATDVDDFFAGPNSGLVVRQGAVTRARDSGFGHNNRFGVVDKDKGFSEKKEWYELPAKTRTVYVAKEASYFWDQTGQLWEAGRRYPDWDGKSQHPDKDKSPRKVLHHFTEVYQDDAAVFGIDKQARLWVRGEFYDRDSGNVRRPVKAADWMLRETDVAQYASCSGDEIKLTLDGALYARGDNYIGKLGAGKKIHLNRWTLINTGVKAFTIDCSRLAIPHSFTTLYALKKDASLWGVGNNRHGQLGVLPQTAEYSTEWCLIARDVVSFEANEYTLMMLKSDGSVWASGSHSGDTTQRNYQGKQGQVVPLGDFRRP